MLSRVADSIFWMSRYLERAENVARFIDVNLNLTLDLGESIGEQWDPLVATTGDHAAFRERFGVATQENVLAFLTFDAKNPNSILSCLRSARDNARTVRENISAAMWEEVNKFYLTVRGAAVGGGVLDSPYDFYNQIRLSSNLLVGIMDSTMSRGEGWHFARMGRLLERADKTSRILDVKYFILLPHSSDVGTQLDVVQWSALLKSASALEMYRQRRGRITPDQVADFLILDRDFPRSAHFCLLKSEESLHTVTGTPIGTFKNAAEQRLGRLRSELDYLHVQDIIEQGMHEFIDSFQNKLNRVGDAVLETFFAPPRPAGQSQTQTQTQRIA